jgi:hypothetical protein
MLPANHIAATGSSPSRTGDSGGPCPSKAEPRFRFSILPGLPKASLLTGSILVLLTLFLPVAYSQCGAIRWTGSEYLLGVGTWPGCLAGLSYSAGRIPFLLSLLLASLTLVAVLAAVLRRSPLETWETARWLFIAAGTLSLFTIGDFFWFQLGYRAGDLLNVALTQHSIDVLFLILSAITIAVAIALLFSRLLRSQKWVLWLLAIAAGISVFTLINYAVALSGSSPAISLDSALLLTASPSILYFVVPLGLWYQFGLSRRKEFWTRWPAIRRSLILLYLPAFLFDLFALSLEMRPGRLWGLLPYFMGINLVSWGYLAVAKASRPERTSSGRHEDKLEHFAELHSHLSPTIDLTS